MDFETLASLIAFAALLIVWIGAPAGVEQREEMGSPAAVPAEA